MKNNKEQLREEKIPKELKSLEGMAEWISRYFMQTVDLDVDPPVTHKINYEDARKKLVKYVLPAILAQNTLETRTEEVMLFMEELQKRADNIPPSLLLNEIVNYAFERIAQLEQKKSK